MGRNEAYAMCRWTLPNGSRLACTDAHQKQCMHIWMYKIALFIDLQSSR